MTGGHPLLHRRALMDELSDWDGNTGRAARLAIQTIEEFESTLRAMLMPETATDPEHTDCAMGAWHFDTHCAVCKAHLSHRWTKHGASGGGAKDPHVEGCVVAEVERMLDGLRWRKR